MKKFSLIKIVSLLLIASLFFSLSGCSLKKTEESSANKGDIKKYHEEISEVCQSISNLKKSEDYVNKDVDAKTDMVLKEIKRLAKDKKIKSDSIYCDEKNHVITFEYSDGTLGCDIVGGFDKDTNFPGEPSEVIMNDRVYPASGEGRKTNALILETNTLDGFKKGFLKCREIAEKWSKAGINTKIDETVTLDDIANLKGYEFVYFHMHGFYGRYSLKSFDYLPCVCLTQMMDNELFVKYYDDLHANKAVGIATDDTVFITPYFFKTHYSSGSLSDTIFYFGTCQQMGANGSKKVFTLFEALGDLSVSACVAYYNSVLTLYDLELVDTFMGNLILGKTAKKSLEDAQADLGYYDVDWYNKNALGPCSEHEKAYAMLLSAKNATLKWEGEASETTIPTSETPETTGTSESSSGEASNTTSAAKVTVKVTDAVKKKVKYGDSKTYYRIPKVAISGKKMDSVNSKIKKELSKAYSSDWYEMGYQYYIDDKIVSIIVQIESTEVGTDFACKAYNISIETGKLISDGDVLKLYGTTKSKFFSSVKKCINKFGGGTKEASNKERKYCIKKNLKRASYKYVDPYINKNGHLCFVGNFYWMNLEEGDYNKSKFAFDTTTNKEIVNPGGLHDEFRKKYK